MKKRWIMAAVLACFLGACSNHSQQATKHVQKVTIMLDWYPNAVHSFLYVAQEKGYFKAQGLDVSIKMPSDTNDPLKLAAANRIDIALSYQPQVLIARDEKIPVQSLAPSSAIR